MNKITLKLSIISVITAISFVALPSGARAAYVLPANGDPNVMVCIALANLLPCTPAAAKTTTKITTTGSNGSTTTTTQTGTSSSFLSRLLGGGSSDTTRNLSANISQGFTGTTQKNLAIVLVKVPDSSDVYRIIGGKKFLVPNEKVFDSYGYIASDITSISASKLATYPRVKVVRLEGYKDVYYLTDTGMTRKIISDTVFASYADREEDVVIINKTEFSMYPQNIYVYNEDTFNLNHQPNVYQIGSSTKKLVFPDQLEKLGVTNSMIAPINQIEFDSYQILLLANAKTKLWYNFF